MNLISNFSSQLNQLGRKAIQKTRKATTTKMNIWLEALLIELQSMSLANLTIDDLAQVSGKSKTTIYKYFESKEEVVLAACETRIKVVIGIVKNIEVDKTAPIEVRYTKLLEQFSSGVSDISITFLHDIKTYYPTSWSAINRFNDAFIKLLGTLYQEGIKGGVYHPISIELLGALDKFFVTQIVTDQSIFEDPNYTLSHLVRDYLHLRLRGLNK